MPAPRYPVYIVSKGRWESRLTMRWLDWMGVPFRVVVEEAEREAYAAAVGADRLLILDPEYRRAYDTCDDRGDALPPGSGPARNFVWDHAAAAGAERYWLMDDNIAGFFRKNRNHRILCADGTPFRAMEDFVDRYENVAMAGPHYLNFVHRRNAATPYLLNTRIFSCQLIATAAPFRWRCRFNEDLDLSLRMLKAGWCTVLFNAWVHAKRATQSMRGGNTDSIYIEGTLEKSKMAVAMHPDHVRLVWRFGRPHHYVNFRPYARTNLLKRRPGVDVDALPAVNDYGMRLVPAPAGMPMRPRGKS